MQKSVNSSDAAGTPMVIITKEERMK